MGLTVSNQAVNTYTQYVLQNSDTYKNNSVDESEISSEAYGISNLTNAIDAMENAFSVDLNSVGNVDSYVNTLYEVSQTDVYDLLSDNSDSSALDLLSGDDDDSLSDIYSLIAPDTEASAAFLESVAANATAEDDSSSDAESSSDTTSYNTYLSGTQTSSLLDVSV